MFFCEFCKKFYEHHFFVEHLRWLPLYISMIPLARKGYGKSLIFQLFITKLLFVSVFDKKNISFASTSLVSDFKLTRENDGQDTNKFLRCRTLCASMLKCGFPTKAVKLTRSYFLRYLECLSFGYHGLGHFGSYRT